jgi:hypothetical protein
MRANRADIQTATALGRPTIFPPLNDIDRIRLPLDIQEESECPCVSQLLNLAGTSRNVVGIFTILRQLAMLQMPEWAGALSPNDTRVLLNGCDTYVLSNFSEHTTASPKHLVTRSLLAAAHVFLYGALRNIPMKSKIYQVLISRLQKTLEEVEVLLTAWKDDASPFLWVLFIGYAATYEPESSRKFLNQWFLYRLKVFLSVLQQETPISKDIVMERLKGLVWTEGFCAAALESLWEADVQGK